MPCAKFGGMYIFQANSRALESLESVYPCSEISLGHVFECARALFAVFASCVIPKQSCRLARTHASCHHPSIHSPHRGAFDLSLARTSTRTFLFFPPTLTTRQQRDTTRQMAPTAVIERQAPDVVPNATTRAPVRSRLPTALRVPILISLNMGINMLLWEFTANFLKPELGAVSKVPNEDDVTSFYSPVARIAMRFLTVWMTWYFNYDCKSHHFCYRERVRHLIVSSLRCLGPHRPYLRALYLPPYHLLRHLGLDSRGQHLH